jgi:hypothetical protein
MQFYLWKAYRYLKTLVVLFSVFQVVLRLPTADLLSREVVHAAQTSFKPSTTIGHAVPQPKRAEKCLKGQIDVFGVHVRV